MASVLLNTGFPQFRNSTARNFMGWCDGPDDPFVDDPTNYMNCLMDKGAKKNLIIYQISHLTFLGSPIQFTPVALLKNTFLR